jgi:hypothetical protein
MLVTYFNGLSELYQPGRVGGWMIILEALKQRG